MRLMALLLLPLAGAALAQDRRGVEIPGQRDGGSLVYHADRFDGVALGSAATVEVRVGPTWSVRATGPAKALAMLRVERNGRSLTLGRQDRRAWRNYDLEKQVRVFVTLPRLASAAVGGSGRMLVERISGGKLNAAVGGSGSLAFGTVAVEELDVAIGGSGTVTAAGTAALLKVSSGGSGAFRAPGLRAARADVTTAGSGDVRANVVGPANVSLVGSGGIDLGPRARCSVSRMGSGRVVCGG